MTVLKTTVGGSNERWPNTCPGRVAGRMGVEEVASVGRVQAPAKEDIDLAASAGLAAPRRMLGLPDTLCACNALKLIALRSKATL